VSTESDEQWVRIRIDSLHPVSEEAVGDYAASLASALGIEWRAVSGHLELRLPTLKAHRAAAREGGAGATEAR
jgi:DNA-binding transcriptional ArsR family regulator